MVTSEATVQTREEITEAIRTAMLGILEDRGWSQTRLAAATGENRKAIWRWLKGDTTPPAWFIGKFCQALEVDASSVVATKDARSMELDRRRALHDTGSLLARIAGELRNGRIPAISA